MKKLFLLLAVIVATTVSALAQSRTVSGVVLDADTDEPLVGATVQPVGGGAGVAADINGHFTLTVPNSVKEVTVSYIGMTSKTVAITDNMVISLSPSANRLDEVVVTGYGSGKKLGSVVGSVSVVDNTVLEETPSVNFVDALQGQVPGLTIFSNSGEPSAVPESIRIRGVNSLDAGTTPLFILDGAPVSTAVFNALNPADIENVTVLKDAASTAIYGSRAANGVIVITSKKGKFGEKAKVTIRANIGWSAVADEGVELMNSKQYVEFRDKIGMPVSDEARHAALVLGIDTDWRDELIKDDALLYSMEARISGGTEHTRYYISLNHYDQDGLIPNSGIRRESLGTNLDTKVNNWLQVGLSTNIGYENYQSNANATGRYATNPFSQAEALLPYDAPYYYTLDENGNMIKGDEAEYYHYSQAYNPNWLNNQISNSTRKKVSLVANLYEQITPVKGLTLRAQQAVNGFDYNYSGVNNPLEDFVTPMGDQVNLSNSYPADNSQLSQRNYQFTYTNTAEYKFDINDKHYITALLGQESIIYSSSYFRVTSEGQPDADQWLLGQGTSVTMSDLTQVISKYTINSWFFNANYEYDNRYFVDFNIRRDGSSKFAPGHRWSTFYAIGAAWNIKGESFMDPYKWLTDLKLRINYGTTGNSSIDNYAYQGTVAAGRIYNGESSMGLSTQSNEDLTWETVKSFDVGVDFGFLDRINGTVDFYHKTTDDMLMEIPYSFTTGYTDGYANIGSMTNTGFEVDVNFDIYKSKDWYVGFNANFGYNSIEIKELFNGLDEFTISGTGVTYEVGKNPFNLHNVRYAGVDPRDGQQMWYDKDGNLTKNYNADDAVDLGKSFVSPWNGGFGVSARYKNISLRADFNWAAKKYMFNGNYWYTKTAQICQSQNGSTDLLRVWTKPGDVTDIPNIYDLYGQAQEVQADSRFVENSSFLRLKNLTVNYTLPQKWTNAIDIQAVNFHFTGRNLLTFSPFKGADPEYEANVIQFSYPNTRQFEFGVDVTF